MCPHCLGNCVLFGESFWTVALELPPKYGSWHSRLSTLSLSLTPKSCQTTGSEPVTACELTRPPWRCFLLHRTRSVGDSRTRRMADPTRVAFVGLDERQEMTTPKSPTVVEIIFVSSFHFYALWSTWPSWQNSSRSMPYLITSYIYITYMHIYTNVGSWLANEIPLKQMGGPL